MSNTEVRLSSETVTKNYAEVFVNGTSKGKKEINGGPSLKDFATAVAAEFGIRTFTVTVDSKPVTAAQAAAPVQSGQSIGVQAKDSRGADGEDTSVSQPDGEGSGDAGEVEGDDDEADEGEEAESSSSSSESDEAAA